MTATALEFKSAIFLDNKDLFCGLAFRNKYTKARLKNLVFFLTFDLESFWCKRTKTHYLSYEVCYEYVFNFTCTE